MFLTDIARTASFRLAASLSLAFGAITLLLFAFIYWQTASLQAAHMDRFIAREVQTLARLTPADALRRVDIGLASDLHRMTIGAIFDKNGHLLSGNLPALPPGFLEDGQPHSFELTGADRMDSIRAAGLRTPDGRILIVGRNANALIGIRHVVGRALALGLIPTVFLSLGAGALLSLRMLNRLKLLNLAIGRIMKGNLAGRLPSRNTGDDLDRLIASVNRMLAELEQLVTESKNVGDNIAHDLRTPLARLRARLELGRDVANTVEELRAVLDKAINDVDQTFNLVAALLRITEIENGRRREGFGKVDLKDLLEELEDLYRPMAEERNLFLAIQAEAAAPVYGDRDLLMEVFSNLLDNALKFTPPGGKVTVALRQGSDGPVLSVADTGPGIPAADKDRIFKRFYRGDKSRHAKGCGLGLSIVAAIVRLHGFSLRVLDGAPGCVFQLAFTSNTSRTPGLKIAPP